VQNIQKWPSSFFSRSTFAGYGSPVFYTARMANLFAGNPMQPFKSSTGVVSIGTDLDTVFGTVAKITFAPTSGNSETNRVFLGAPPTPSVAFDYVMSVLLKSNIDCSVTFGSYPANAVGETIPLAAGNWTRAVVAVSAHGVKLNPLIFVTDSSGCSLDVAGYQITGGPSGTLATQAAISQTVATGAVGSDSVIQ